MIVAGANLSFAASHRYEASHERSERLKTWTGIRPPDQPAASTSPLASLREAVAKLQQSAATSDYQTGRLAKQARSHEAKQAKDGKDGEAELSPEQQKIVMLLEKLFGIKGVKQFSMKMDYSSVQEVQAVAQEATRAQSGGPVGWGMEYDYHEAYREYESTSLAMSGTFTTEDGRAFAFNLDYKLEREYVRTTDISIRAGDAVVKDPLILDVGGVGGFAAGSSSFDLDRDGQADALRHLTNGSKYLAADFNRNGRIDDGGELFGPTSGNGFADLAAHDDDGNGFIDQGDAIWELLRLWTGDEAKPALLAQWKIAAIGLTSIEAPFSYKDANNDLIGENRRAGVYLTDDGKAGVAKQVDLVA
jgi:hypothetical protein